MREKNREARVRERGKQRKTEEIEKRERECVRVCVHVLCVCEREGLTVKHISTGAEKRSRDMNCE